MKKLLFGSMYLFLLISCNNNELKKVNSEMYKPILNKENIHHFLFKDSKIRFLKQKYAFGNNREKVFAYNFMNKQRIIIWELSGLKNINIDSISIRVDAKRCEKVEITPHSRVEFGNPSLVILKTPTYYTATKLNILFSPIRGEIDSSRYNNRIVIRGTFKGVCLNSSDLTNMLKLDYLKNTFPTELMLLKTNSNFYMILSDIMDRNVNEESVFKYISIDSLLK